MAITTTSNLPPEVLQTFQMRLLAIKIPGLIHNVAAMRVMMPKNGGTTSRHRRYAKFALPLAPVGNTGVNPPSQNTTAIDIDVKLQLYGTSVIINEQVILQNQDPVLNYFTKLLGINLRETEDVLTRDMLASTSSFINCVNGGNGDNPTNLGDQDVNNVVQSLLNNDATMIMDSIEGADKFATAPVRECYLALASTRLYSDIQSLTGFEATSQYPSPMNELRNEFGAVRNLRFLISSIGSVVRNASNRGADVFNVFCVAQEAYGITHQDGYSAQLVYTPPQFSGPLAMNASLAWKAMFGSRIYNDQWVLALRCTQLRG